MNCEAIHNCAQGQEDTHHPSGKSSESVRFGSRFPAGALLMRTGWQKGTVPFWAVGVQISAPALTSWASYFTSLGLVSSEKGDMISPPLQDC